MESPEAQPTLPHTVHFPGRYHEQGQHPWRSTRCSEEGLRESSASGAEATGITQKIAPRDSGLASDLEHQEVTDVAEARDVTL